MSTTAEHIAARNDGDLRDRLIAAAEQRGILSPASAVDAQLGRLVSIPITVAGQATSVTDVHAYANAVRKEYLADSRALPAGLNPGAVTDDHLRAAIDAVFPQA